MSTATVRAAIAQFIQAAEIQGLNRVFTAPPWWADGQEWQLNNSLGSGAIGCVHMVEDTETRIAGPALTGQKIVTYKVGLMIFYQWLKPSNTPVPVAEDAWAAPLDDILDGLKALLRSDPNCGMPTVIWQSAQTENDLKIMRDIPRQLPGKVLAWNVLEFTVDEVITA